MNDKTRDLHYVDVSSILAAPKLSRVDQLYHQLRDHVPVLSHALPDVLIRLVASYAPHRLILLVCSTPHVLLWALDPLAAINAGNYRVNGNIGTTPNTSAMRRESIIAAMPQQCMTLHKKYTANDRFTGTWDFKVTHDRVTDARVHHHALADGVWLLIMALLA